MDGLFGFSSMGNDYEQRKIARYEDDDLIIDICRVTDSAQDYETAVSHRAYNNSDWVIVELRNRRRVRSMISGSR